VVAYEASSVINHAKPVYVCNHCLFPLYLVHSSGWIAKLNNTGGKITYFIEIKILSLVLYIKLKKSNKEKI